MSMTTADWYFDFISPYAYFASLQLDALSSTADIRYRPVLLAGLLNHWGQKGPAEIDTKRKWTYRWCTWWAGQQGIPFRLPAAHPFNPLAYLRLAIAADCSAGAIHAIFKALWTTGDDPANPDVLARLATSLDVDPALPGTREIKDELRYTTDRAIGHGVFGVPTMCIGGELFWGVEGIALVRAFLADQDMFSSAEMRRVGNLPVGATRRDK